MSVNWFVCPVLMDSGMIIKTNKLHYVHLFGAIYYTHTHTDKIKNTGL